MIKIFGRKKCSKFVQRTNVVCLFKIHKCDKKYFEKVLSKLQEMLFWSHKKKKLKRFSIIFFNYFKTCFIFHR